MRRLALLLLLALAGSAIAQPSYPPPDRSRPAPYRDRYDRRPQRPDLDRRRFERDDTWRRRARDVHHHWRTLNVSADARYGRTMVTIPAFYPTVSAIRVEAAYGMPLVSRIDVFYAGRVQTFQIHNRLTPGEGIEIQLDPYRTLRSIVIYTQPRYRGGVSVWGR